MSVIRSKKRKNFTAMSNCHLRDKRLSLKAKGLMSLMLSLPEDWEYSIRGLSHICKEGIYSIRNVVMELENCGYVERRKINVNGKLEVEYLIYEKPKTANPTLENLMSEKPISENSSCSYPMLENHTQ